MQRSGCLTAYALLVCFSADGAMQTSALSSVPGTGSLKPTTATAFTFIVAGDSRPAKADLPPPPQPGEILAAAKPASAAFVVWTGDTIYGLNPQTNDTTPPPNRTDPSGLPPVYLVSGGAGAPLVGTPATGGFYHYLVFQVNGNQVNARLVKLQ